MRVTVRVHPGARTTAVGGEHAGALVVRVAERAVDGKATAAAMRALAEAFNVPPRNVTLISGIRSRSKVVEIEGAGRRTLARLLTTKPTDPHRRTIDAPNKDLRPLPARSVTAEPGSVAWFFRLIEQVDGRWMCRGGLTDFDSHDTISEAFEHLKILAADRQPAELIVHHQDGRIEHRGAL